MIFFPAIYFTLIIFILQRKFGFFNIGIYILLVFWLSSIFSIIGYHNSELDFNQKEINLIPTIFYCSLITISILPFVLINNARIRLITKPNINAYNFFSFVLITAFLFTLLNFISDLSTVLNGNLSDIRNNIAYETYGANKVGIRALILKVSTFFSNFSSISLFFYFYSVIYLKKGRIFNTLLFLSSFTPVLFGILVAGRTQVVYWFLTYFLVYFLFYSLLEKKNRRKLLLPIFIILPLLGVYFIVLTLARFPGDSQNMSALNSIISYCGQSFPNFCSFYETYEFKDASFARLFPFINKYILGNQFVLQDYRYKIFMETSLHIGIFYTYLGDLLVDIGKIGTIIYVFVFTCLSRIIMKRKFVWFIPFHSFFPLFVFALIPLQGVFYYSYWKVEVSFYIIGSLIMYIVFYKKISRLTRNDDHES